MPSIVISYRRADTGQIAGRIFDRLEAHFGRDSVFMDIDGIPIGADFRDRVKSVLGDCDVVLALVGPHWADGGSHHDRLSDEADWVRIEVEMALANKVPVIPVLIDQSQFPPAADVPASVRDIVFKQAARVDTGIDFDPHVDRLIRAIAATIGTQTPTGPQGAKMSSAATSRFAGFPASLFSNRNVAIGIGALVAVVVAVLLVFLWPRQETVTQIVPALSPAAGGDILQVMESQPMSHDVRTAFERARGASAAATHAVNEAREALARARGAAEKAARHDPGYDEMDSTNSQGVTRHYAGGVSGGHANGFGIITIPSSGSTYSGQMQDGGPAGVGVYARGKLLYEGQFSDGDFNGVGVLNMDSTSTAPERLSGEFKNGQLDGDGLHINAGNVYFGHWVEGKRSGYGVVFDSDGKVVEQGIYRNGELVRRLNAND